MSLSDEFDPRSGRHVSQKLICTDRSKYRNSDLLKIVDDDVFNEENDDNGCFRPRTLSRIWCLITLRGSMIFHLKIYDIISLIAESVTTS